MSRFVLVSIFFYLKSQVVFQFLFIDRMIFCRMRAACAQFGPPTKPKEEEERHHACVYKSVETDQLNDIEDYKT